MNVLIRSYVRTILIEGIVDDVKKTYAEAGPFAESIIDFFSESDPSKRNKYLKWSMKQFTDNYGGEGAPDAQEIAEVVRAFHVHPNYFSSKDINTYDYRSLHDEMMKIKPSKTAVKRESKLGAVKVLEIDQFVMYRIDTRRVCVQYGMGTKWCVSAGSTDNWWNDHTKISVLYMLIDSESHKKMMLDYRWKPYRDFGGTGSVPEDTKVYDETDEQWSFWQIPLFFGPEMTGKGRMSEEQLKKVERTIRDDAKNSPWVQLSLRNDNFNPG